jgi:hypothetical protein
MRLEYTFNIADVPVPRFAVEAVEGIGKLFTLATLVVNVLAVRPRVEIVFHGLNPQDPTRKIDAFREILASCEAGSSMRFQAGQGGHVPGSSSYFQWLSVERGEPA